MRYSVGKFTLNLLFGAVVVGNGWVYSGKVVVGYLLIESLDVVGSGS